MKESHVGFKARECGLFIDPKRPYLGASPGMVVECDCCGTGLLLEVKCPYSAAHVAPTIGAPLCLVEKYHNYYKQMQDQLAVMGRERCGFVCTKHGGVSTEDGP